MEDELVTLLREPMSTLDKLVHPVVLDALARVLAAKVREAGYTRKPEEAQEAT